MVHELSPLTRVLDRFKVTSILAGIGAVSGALAAVVLTFLSNAIAGSPLIPGVITYSWNIGVFAVCGAVFGPPLAWSMLRRVPLWRTLTEPALGGVVGTLITMLTAPVLFPVIVPTAILASAWRLNYAYRDRNRMAELRSPRGGINRVAGHHGEQEL